MKNLATVGNSVFLKELTLTVNVVEQRSLRVTYYKLILKLQNFKKRKKTEYVKYSFTFKKTTCCFEFMEAWTQVKGRFGSLGCGSWG